MDTENSQVETQPKYKVGDLVWLPIPFRFGGEKGVSLVQTTITAVVYSRYDGKSTFGGYMTANEHGHKVVMESGVFATRAEVEALIDKLAAEIKAEEEGE